jgi:hypothetical protein
VSRVREALNWSGSGSVLSLFAAFPKHEIRRLSFSSDENVQAVEEFLLEDPEGVLPNVEIVEYDFDCAELPANLDSFLRSTLHRAQQGGALVAWFGFEGSFHFDFLLVESIADQIFGVVDHRGIDLALLDEEIASPAWSQRIRRAGDDMRNS